MIHYINASVFVCTTCVYVFLYSVYKCSCISTINISYYYYITIFFCSIFLFSLIKKQSVRITHKTNNNKWKENKTEEEGKKRKKSFFQSTTSTAKRKANELNQDGIECLKWDKKFHVNLSEKKVYTGKKIKSLKLYEKLPTWCVQVKKRENFWMEFLRGWRNCRVATCGSKCFKKKFVIQKEKSVKYLHTYSYIIRDKKKSFKK